ncbi:hypothetical protein VNO77_41494 [Canavalia gladiata]|uniref:Uncharacterized protein n=1 Tax=Canavalia gladiata TaxID=3824 RepID=A0AAN9PQ99_CANGL
MAGENVQALLLAQDSRDSETRGPDMHDFVRPFAGNQPYTTPLSLDVQVMINKVIMAVTVDLSSLFIGTGEIF